MEPSLTDDKTFPMLSNISTAEADRAGDLDERQSTTGYWFTNGGGAKLARGV